MINKLLRTATTPESVLAAFRQVYGPNVKTTLSIDDDGQILASGSVSNFILWSLEGTKRNTPSWINLTNRPLIQVVSVVMIPSFDPRWLVSSSENLPFLTSLSRKSLRVNRSGRQGGCTGSILRCAPTNSGGKKNKKMKRSRPWDGGSATPPESFIVAQRQKKVVPNDLATLLSDGVQLFRDHNIVPDDTYVTTEGRRRADKTSISSSSFSTTSSTTSSTTTPTSPTTALVIAAIDCEMCVTKNGLELTRVSILNGQGLCVYDKLVKPVDLIIDYATQYSGITKHMLENVTDTLLDNVHRDLFTSDDALIDEATIVVGHSIENDLKALKVLHRRVIDSAIVYPHPRGPPYRSALRFLTKKWLGRKIQQGDTTTGGHDSAEDALGALDLVLMKYRCGPTFGTTDVTEKGESIFRWMEREGSQSSSLAGEEEEEESGGGGGGRGGGGGGGGGGTKRCAIVGDPMSIRKYMEGGVDAIVANGNDDQIVSKSIKCLTSHRLVCTILSEADDLDMERAQKMKDARRRGEEEKEVEKEEGEEEGTPKSSSSSELLSLVSELTCSPLQQQRMDSHVRSIYNAMPSNGLLIVCMQGGVHSSNQLRTASELTPADHAVICFAVRESVSQTTEVEKTW